MAPAATDPSVQGSPQEGAAKAEAVKEAAQAEAVKVDAGADIWGRVRVLGCLEL